MDGLRTPLSLGMTPSLLQIHFALAYSVPVLLAALGVLTLMLAGTAGVTEPLLRRLTWFNVFWVAGFLLVNLHYQVPPPIISAALIEAVLIARVFKG